MTLKQQLVQHSVHQCPFLVVKFQCFFCYIQSLVAEIICHKYSFIHAHIQNSLKKRNVLKIFLFSTEVINPLHEHLLVQIYIQISFCVLYNQHRVPSMQSAAPASWDFFVTHGILYILYNIERSINSKCHINKGTATGSSWRFSILWVVRHHLHSI